MKRLDKTKTPRSQGFYRSFYVITPLTGQCTTKGATFFYCCTCRFNFSIGHGGRDDCKRHMACKRHKEYAELRRTCPSVSSTFKQKETPLVLKTTLMDSNLPLSAANKFTKTLKEMFPDSEIARCDAFLTESLNFQRNHVFGP